MNKTYLVILFITLFLNGNTDAQEQSPLALIKPTSCSFSGTFIQQKSLLGLDNALESNGVFFYDCDYGIIWKTISPIIESLVLNQSDENYLVKRLKIEPIQSSQNKLLSQLIMALIGGDDETLSKLFAISSINANEIELTPTNRRIQQAIVSIKLTIQAGSENSSEQVTIEIIDRNKQITSITSTKNQDYSSVSDDSVISDKQVVQHCTSIDGLEPIECGLLKSADSIQQLDD